jgi:hypothetical protein
MIEIESSIPLPPGFDKDGNKPRYPIAELEVGESIFFPVKHGFNVAENQSQYWRKKLGRSYTVRQIIEGGVLTGWRLWRVK